MRERRTPAIVLVLCFAAAASFLRADEQHSSAIFDGATLNGWSSPDMSFWSVKDGAITAQSTPDHPCKRNQFLVWDGEVADFELTLKFRIMGDDSANSGVQFRSVIKPDGHAEGYQADIDRGVRWLGTLYDEHTGRRVLAARGEKTVIDADGSRLTTRLRGAERVLDGFDPEAWNEYRIIADGPRLTLQINGMTTAEVIDHQADHADASGKLALQLHSGPPMTVQFRDIRLRRLPETED